MTGNRFFFAITAQPNEVNQREVYMNSRRKSLIVGVTVFAAAVFTVRVAATSDVRAAMPQENARPAVHYDLNALPGYHASEWGFAGLAAAPVAAYDLNALPGYRASEWGLAAAEAASVDAFDLNALPGYHASEWALPESVPAAWHDLNTFPAYRASEWGHAPNRLTAESLYHDLMAVK